MDVIEFLQRTNHRNLKFNIDYQVKQKMREREEELKCRQLKLRDMLAAESMQYDEELLELLNARLKASEEKRIEWIGLMRVEREQAEEELVKVKNMQRELENCEGWRHLESRKILIDAKRGQLYQIAEKRARQQKEEQIDCMWQRAMDRLHAEQARHQLYEEKLQKVIADANQARNEKNDQDARTQRKDEQKSLREDYAQDDARAAALGQLYRQVAEQQERQKNLQHNLDIRQQMRANDRQMEHNKTLAMQEGIYNRMQEDEQCIRQLNDKIGQRIQNREWHKSYLSHVAKEQQQQRDAAKAVDDAYLDTGCVLQQERKTPYGKFVR